MLLRATLFILTLWLAALTSTDGAVRVASYNVRNYTGADRITESGWTPDYPKPEGEKDALRAAILAVKPDVIVFQEMGPAEYLEELRRDLAAAGIEYQYSAHLVASDTERCLAALSRIPIEEVGRNSSITCKVGGETVPVKRGLLSLTFVTNGKRWTVYDMHLKSRVGPKKDEAQNTAERNAEAAAIRNEIIREQGENGMWVLAGDTNDIPGSGAWNRLLAKGERKLCVDLRPKDSRGEYWTYYYKKIDSYERIDAFLASPIFYEMSLEGSPTIYDGAGSMDASDHRMIYADFDVR